MKRFLFICLVALSLPRALLAGQDRIELGSLITGAGLRLVVEYVVLDGAYHEADLVWPDGRQIKIAVEPGTTTQTLNRALQQIADAQ